jgi:hypothetical protein
LPGRKNRLASLHSLAKNLHRSFLHFGGCHVLPPFCQEDLLASGRLKTLNDMTISRRSEEWVILSTGNLLL